MLIRLVPLLASAQEYWPQTLSTLVLQADKGAVAKGTLVAMSLLLPCMHRIHLSSSFQAPPDSCGLCKPKNAVGSRRKEKEMATQPGATVLCARAATYTSVREAKGNEKLASYHMEP